MQLLFLENIMRVEILFLCIIIFIMHFLMLFSYEHYYYHPSRLRAQYEVYYDKNGTNFLLYRITENILQDIPDTESACETVLVGVTHSECSSLKDDKNIFVNVTTIPDNILQSATYNNVSLPFLGIHITPWSAKIDELMRTEVDKFQTFLPLRYIMKQDPVFIKGYFHGNQIRFKGFGDNTSYFAVWRNVTLDTVNFGILHTNNFSLQLNERMFLPNAWNGRVYSQQEARVGVLSESALFIICTSRFSSRAPYGQMYTIMQKDAQGDWQLGPPILLDYNRSTDNKNFVPLVHPSTGTLYLLPSINPLVISSSFCSGRINFFFNEMYAFAFQGSDNFGSFFRER